MTTFKIVPRTVQQVRSSLIAWFPMSGPASRHGLGWGLEQGNGYDPLFENHITPLGNRGLIDYGIWMPFSFGNMDEPGQHLNLDAPSDLKELGLWHLVSDLAYHIRRHRHAFPAATATMYLGSIREPEFLSLQSKQRFRAWFQRFYSSIAPLLDEPNVHFVFDAWTGCEENSAGNRILQTVEALIRPRRTYTEGWPLRARADQRHRAICVTEPHYRNSRPVDDQNHTGYPQHNWSTPSQETSVEVIRIDQTPWDHRDPVASTAALTRNVATIVGHPSGTHRAAFAANYVIGRGKPYENTHDFAAAVASTTHTLAGTPSPAGDDDHTPAP